MALPTVVVFDLDGTLIDSAGDIADVLNVVLAEIGTKTLPDQVVRQMIGSGARVLVERALAALDLTGKQPVEALVERFEEVYLALGAGRSQLYPGGREVLAELAAAGTVLAVCTNKPQPVTDVILDELGLRSAFAAVVGVRDGLPRKPAPDMLLTALRESGKPAGAAIMVGDSPIDVATARAAGIPIVAVSYGYSDVAPEELGADVVVDSLHDLIDAFGRIAVRPDPQ
jgi:phosphoglycolate phosphatase